MNQRKASKKIVLLIYASLACSAVYFKYSLTKNTFYTFVKFTKVYVDLIRKF